jgi:hypothetical protein
VAYDLTAKTAEWVSLQEQSTQDLAAL